MELQCPRHAAVEGDDLEQGDLFESCPVYLPTAATRRKCLCANTFGQPDGLACQRILWPKPAS